MTVICLTNQDNNLLKYLVDCDVEMDLKMMIVPDRLLKAVNNLHLCEEGYILIRDVCIKDTKNIPTPPDNKQHIGERTNIAKVQGFINGLLGEMVAYEAEGEGYLYQDMVPNRALANTQTSLSSGVELEVHTEQAFSDLKPDYLSLACIRGNPEAKTYIFHKNTLIKNMSREKVEKLYEPLWMIGVDQSFKMDKQFEFVNGDVRGPIPIIDRKTGYLVFDQDLMYGITEDAEELKREIINLYRAYKREIVLEEGDILIIDNRHMVHGRSPFKPRYDGKDRFIVRSFVMTHDNYKKASNYAMMKKRRLIDAIYS